MAGAMGKTACDEFLPKGGAPLEEGATYTIESLNKRLESEMPEAGTSATMKEIRMWFVDVPDEVIDQICDSKTAFQLKQFDRARNSIQIRMASYVHESASRLGEKMVQKALSRANVGRSMSLTGQGKAPNVPWRTRKGKVPDASFQLRPRWRMGYRLEAWPQIVVETGMSEDEGELTADASWWFTIGGSLVRLVITIAVSLTNVQLTVWILGTDKGTLRRFATMNAQRVDGRLEVTTTAPVIVPFSVVFFREARKGEKDLQFLPEDFAALKDDLERHINERETLPEIPDDTPPYVSATVAPELELIRVEDVPQPKKRRTA